MGTIREVSSGRTQVLEWEHLVGRAGPPKCALVLDPPQVSGVHALLRWSGQSWEVKDLGSLNGTFLDGRRIEPGGVERVRAGSKLSFGRLDLAWELSDESPPVVMVVSLESGKTHFLESDLIALPSALKPAATVYRGADGAWVLERTDQNRTSLSSGQTFDVDGSLWRFCGPPSAAATLASSGKTQLVAADLHLTFSVERTEEFVHLRVACDGQEFDFGSSVNNYLLLTLARRRLADAAQRLPETSCGWLDPRDYPREPMMAASALAIAVYRIRRQFGRTGVVDPACIIERRPHQLRVGTPYLTIVSI